MGSTKYFLSKIGWNGDGKLVSKNKEYVIFNQNCMKNCKFNPKEKKF